MLADEGQESEASIAMPLLLLLLLLLPYELIAPFIVCLCEALTASHSVSRPALPP